MLRALLQVLVFVAAASCVPLGAEDAGLELELVQVLFRHGERTPQKDEAKLLGNASVSIEEPYGFSQLTNNGKMQEYEIGRMLRKRYNDFLGESFRPEYVFASTSNFDRTKNSLQLVLASLYSPSDELVWNNELRWMPIPTYTAPWELDNLFNLKNCHKYERLYDQLMRSNSMKKLLSRYDGLLKFLSKVYPNLKMNIEQTFYLNTLLTTQKIFNVTLPNWYTPELHDQLRNASKFYLDTLSYTDSLKRLNGGSLARRFLENLRAEPQKRRIYLYSGHEFTLYAVAKAHNVTLEKSPGFGSALILEKLRDQQKNVQVRMFYWTGSSKELMPIKLGNCKRLCTLKEYSNIIKIAQPSDDDMRCLYKNIGPLDLEKYFTFDSTNISI